MSTRAFAAVTRHTVAVSRRSSLVALGLASVGATPLLAGAKGKAGKKARKKCRKQVEPCKAAFDPVCEGTMGEEECRQFASECCESLKTCNADAAMTCVVTRFLTVS